MQNVFKKEEMLKVSQVAKRLGCSRQHVHNLIDRGYLKAFRFGLIKLKMIPHTSLQEFLNKSEYDPGA